MRYKSPVLMTAFAGSMMMTLACASTSNAPEAPAAVAVAPTPVPAPAAAFTGSSATPGTPPATETVTFDGLFPCSTCESLRVTLNLRSDGTFMLRCIFAGSTDSTDAWYVDLGYWVTTNDARRLVLYGGYIGTRELAIDDPSTLRFLDFDGKELSKQIVKQTITRTRDVIVFSEPFRLIGTYIFVDGKGMFTEARTGNQFMVEESGEETRLRESFVAGMNGCLRPLRVSFLGHFESRPAADGRIKEVLVIDRFDELIPGEECQQGIMDVKVASYAKGKRL